MSYSLDPKRPMPYMVIDRTSAVGMEGIYAGSLEDCENYLSEQSKHCMCIGMDIVPNPYYVKK